MRSQCLWSNHSVCFPNQSHSMLFVGFQAHKPQVKSFPVWSSCPTIHVLQVFFLSHILNQPFLTKHFITTVFLRLQWLSARPATYFAMSVFPTTFPRRLCANTAWFWVNSAIDNSNDITVNCRRRCWLGRRRRVANGIRYGKTPS